MLKGRRKNVTIFKVSKVDRSALKSAPRQLIKSIFRRFQTAVRSLRSLTCCRQITYDDVTRHGTLTSVWCVHNFSEQMGRDGKRRYRKETTEKRNTTDDHDVILVPEAASRLTSSRCSIIDSLRVFELRP